MDVVTFAVSFVLAAVVACVLLRIGYRAGRSRGESDGYIRALRWVRHRRDHGFQTPVDECPTCKDGAP